MTINLYRTNADPREINKISNAVLINPDPIVIKPTELVNLARPTFEIDYNSEYMTANYCYCDEFDRYYYVLPPHLNTGKRLEIPCVIDVRQSFSSAILDTECTIIRAESIAQPTKIQDTKLPINPASKIVTSIVLPETSHTFDTDANYSYLLTVVGGSPGVGGDTE